MDFNQQIAQSFSRELECLTMILRQAEKRGLVLKSLSQFNRSARAVVRELEDRSGSLCCAGRVEEHQ